VVDEAAYREARLATVERRCVFEAALLSRCAGCATSVRVALAEREAIGCASPAAHADCTAFASLLRERALFALKLPPGAPPPHAVVTKLQCGGITGLHMGAGVLGDDVRRLVAAAIARHGRLVDLPWSDIVAAVVRWQGRRRHAPEGR